MTAATQPSIEDVVGGALPWIPKVRLPNPFLSFENGDDFLARFRLAAKGKVDPFILVVQGSIPNEKNKEEGAPAEVRLLRDLRFLTRLSGRLPVRYRYFNLPKQVHHLLGLIPLASCHTLSLFQCVSYSLAQFKPGTPM
jgi:hypothetical protein